MIKAALFDLDGVVLDTESQYSRFWGDRFRCYYPETSGMEQKIKGMTLVQIYDAYFADQPDIQDTITRELNDFERHMTYDYIPGFERFVRELRDNHVFTAVVTSSNRPKMKSVCAMHPELDQYFDKILTSEDFSKSKPDPECYLKGAETFGVLPCHCVGFEDSINGLKSVRGAGLFSVALATTNDRHVVEPLADMVVDDFTQIRFVDGHIAIV